MKRYLVLLTVFSIVMLLSSVLAHAEEDVLLAKIGDKKIMMSDLKRMISYYDPEKQKILEQQPQFKATILQRIVQGMVLSKIAKDNGFDKRPDIKEQIELMTNDLLASQYLLKEVVGKINVTEEDISLYYKAHLEEFRTPEMVRARHILVKVEKSAQEDDKKKAKDKIEDILKKLKAGEDFAKLASEFSDDPGSKNKGGDLGFFPKGRMVPDFEKVAFSLKPNEVSDIVETPFGYHIIKIEEKKESVQEPLEKVKDKVREKVFADLRKARVDEFVEKAMKDAGVELNLEP
ncbi:MAG: peptidylprolyl isomerase, partial [Thermodesulfovibrionales bacterium]